jgi:hypothetical protein
MKIYSFKSKEKKFKKWFLKFQNFLKEKTNNVKPNSRRSSKSKKRKK